MKNDEKKEFKSKAKVIGLKSTFVLDDNKLYMTSFGKENEAVPEKNIVDKTVMNLANNFEAKAQSCSAICVSNDKYSAQIVVSDPQKQNQLRAKDTIEKKFFGTTFSDNIHIQLAYNIMDINKILGYYINHVIAAINDMRRLGGEESDLDFVGTFYVNKNYNSDRIASSFQKKDLIDWEQSDGKKILKFKQDRLEELYYQIESLNQPTNAMPDKKNEPKEDRFAKEINEFTWNDPLDAFRKTELDKLQAKLNAFVDKKECSWKKEKKENGKSDYYFSRDYFEQGVKDYATCKKVVKSSLYFSDAFSLKDEEKSGNLNTFYQVLRLIGVIRQSLVHDKDYSSLYSACAVDDKTVLNSLFDNRIDGVNRDFMTKNNVNLQILYDLLPDMERVEVAKEYYNFVVRKNYENLGFSVRTLREAMLELDEADASDTYIHIRHKKYDSVRAKINSIWDFLIYRYFKQEPEDAVHFQGKLRGLLDETLKEKLYKERATRLWADMKKQIREDVLPKLSADSLKVYKNLPVDAAVSAAVKTVFAKAENVSDFSKVIYVLSLFLDAKEINMLLTSLINKFDNIASLEQVLSSKELKEIAPPSFVPDLCLKDQYKLFVNSSTVRDELKVVKSLAKMNKSVQGQKNRRSDVKLPHYLDAAALFGLTDEEEVDRVFHLSDGSTATTEQKALRNFFTNNVINSKRFNYIVRFLNPKKAPRIMKNPALVGFILNSLPETQLQRYCRDTDILFDEKKPDYEDMKRQLVKLLTTVSFDSFRSVKQQVEEDSKSEREKQHYIAVIGLYQTVLYLLVKSLVRVNASYAIGMNALEFDFGVMRDKYGTKDFGWEILVRNPDNPNKSIRKANADCITRKYLSDPDLPMNANVKRSIMENEKLYSNILFREYRNVVVHQNAVNALADFSDKFNKVTDVFDLYHCLVFMTIVDKTEKNPKASEKTKNVVEKAKQFKCRNGKTVYENILENNTAVRDFVYALNTPFAYNPARYMNLSCKKIFMESYGK